MIKLILLANFVFFFLLTSGSGGDNDKIKNEWVCVYASEANRQFERWIGTSNSVRTRERRIELLVDCEMDSAISFLQNPHNVILWMKGVEKVEILNQKNSKNRYSHTIFNLPWPFKDKDMVTLYEAGSTSENCYRIQVCSVNNLVPEHDRITRIKDYQAIWEISRTIEKKTKIDFRVICTDPPAFPRAIQYPVVKKIFRQNFTKLKELLSANKKE